ncbi:MAG: TatD family hydrolase [Candidatus Bathyarchaeota archaeon]|nr:MAG: TatD family hydrolase [Candidatus Bathyarchaeota archaeon]
MLVDSHAHLQWESLDRDREAVIKRAIKAGVEKIVTIGFDLPGSRKGVRLARKYHNVYATVGIHPHKASQVNDDVLNKLKRMAERPKVVAIGEIGLDYYRHLSSKQAQQRAFRAQLLLAEELQLPVVIHDREAHVDILRILSRFTSRLKGVLHCFSGSPDMAVQCTDSGFYVSFAGTVTFPNARKLHETAASVSLDKILVETDCPWLAPQDVRGKRNEPAFLKHTVEKIAHLQETSFETVAMKTTKNAHEVFALL